MLAETMGRPMFSKAARESAGMLTTLAAMGKYQLSGAQRFRMSHCEQLLWGVKVNRQCEEDCCKCHLVHALKMRWSASVGHWVCLSLYVCARLLSHGAWLHNSLQIRQVVLNLLRAQLPESWTLRSFHTLETK